MTISTKKLFMPIVASVLIILAGLSCHKDEALQLDSEESSTAITKNLENAACEDENIVVMGIGPTVADARKAWGANARVACYNACSGKTCDDDKSCLLKGVKPFGNETVTRIPDPEGGTQPWFKIEVNIKCKCACGKCSGQKLVGKTVSSTKPTQAQAVTDAKAQALQWCKESGCPPIKGCPQGRRCEGKGVTVEVLKSEDSPTGGHTVEVLITKCRCSCVKAE